MTKSPRKNVLDVRSNSGSFACQADTLPIELPRPAVSKPYCNATYQGHSRISDNESISQTMYLESELFVTETVAIGVA